MKHDIVFLFSKTHSCCGKAKCLCGFNLEGINHAYIDCKIVDIAGFTHLIWLTHIKVYLKKCSLHRPIISFDLPFWRILQVFGH